MSDWQGWVYVCDLSYVINISLDFCSDSKHITLAHAAAFQCICMALISTVWAQLLEQSPAAKTHTQFFFSRSGSPSFPLLLQYKHTHTQCHAITALLVAVLCLNTHSSEPKTYSNTVSMLEESFMFIWYDIFICVQ